MRRKSGSPPPDTSPAGDTGDTASATNASAASIRVAWKTFPRAVPRVHGYDVVAANGGVWFYLPAAVLCCWALSELVGEKEGGLRLAMRRMGLRTPAFWGSWAVWIALTCLLSTLLLQAGGYAFQFTVFTNSNFAVTFLLFFVFAIAMCSAAALASTLIARKQTAQTAGYALILIGFVFQTILCSAYGGLIDLLLQPDVAAWVVLVRWILTLYPPFNMAKAFYDVSMRAAATVDIHEGIVVAGPGFGWGDLFVPRHVEIFDFDIPVPPTWQAIAFMAADAIIFAALALYLDAVLAGNQGKPASPWFPCRACARRCRRKQSSRATDATGSGGTELPPTRGYVALSGESAAPPLLAHMHLREAEEASDDQHSDVDTDDDVREEARLVDSAAAHDFIVVRKLKKTYTVSRSLIQRIVACFRSRGEQAGGGQRRVHAVRGVSLRVREGEALALLGSNGAGKSSLINVLTGLFDASSGDAALCGFPLSTRLPDAQRHLGVCPQHDTLWPSLTASEHAVLFAILKGVPASATKSEAARVLDRVNLTAVAAVAAGTFSGGMRRRLSLAVALIGSPKVVFLDEATTGCDPVNMRAMWRMIEAAKPGRAIVACTHNMLEAETLGDRVAIMASGKVRAIGATLALKRKHGSGYRLSVTSGSHGIRKTVADLQTAAPHATVAGFDADSAAVLVPNEFVAEVPAALRWLESQPESVVGEWGLSDTTLEDVFLRVTERAPAGDGSATRSKPEDETPPSSPPDAGGASSSTVSAALRAKRLANRSGFLMWRALFRKAATLQSRQYRQNACQIVAPLSVMGLMLLLQRIIHTELGGSTTTFVPSIPVVLNANLLSDAHAHHFYGDCTQYYLLADSTADGAGSLFSNGTRSGVLGHMRQRFCQLNTGYVVHQVPFLRPHASFEDAEDTAMEGLNKLGSIPAHTLLHQPSRHCPPTSPACPSMTLPDAIVGVSKMDVPHRTLQYTFSVNDAETSNYHRPNNFTRFGLPNLPQYLRASKRYLTIGQARAALMDAVSGAFLKATGVYGPQGGSLEALYSNAVVSMPEEKTVDTLAIVEVFGAFLFPIALTLQLPVFTYLLVLEKEERLREMQAIAGMRWAPYFGTVLLFNLALYLVTLAFFWIAGIGLQLRFFAQTAASTMGLFMVGWGLALVALAFLLASLLSSKRAATLCGYAVALFGTLTCIVLCDGIYAGSTSEYAVSSDLPWPYLLLAPFGLVRGIYLMSVRCAALEDCYTNLWDVPASDELHAVVWSLYGCAIVYLLLGLYLDAVLPHEYGVPRHPLFCFGRLLPACCRRDAQGRELSPTPQPRNKSPAKTSTAALAAGVAEEAAVCETMVQDLATTQFRPSAASPDGLLQNAEGGAEQGPDAVLHRLRKVYANGKVAVESLSLSLRCGDCVTLLGPNGCGKSTTLSMLLGLFPPTAGEAWVGPHSICDDADGAHALTGFCPQHDVLWKELTVQEHVLFYARVRGVSPEEEVAHVEHHLRAVGLWSVRHRWAGRLSGGMQRRLSLAMALAGDSAIVVLDEPTTGLDPGARRAVWSIIQRARIGRALLFTTHLLDEAQVLASRVAIMAAGRLRAVGPQAALRAQLGAGLRLEVSFAPQAAGAVDEAVRAACSEAESVSRVRSFRGYSLFRIVDGPGGSVAALFERIEEQVGPMARAWSLGNLTLDDVFAEIVGDEEGEQE